MEETCVLKTGPDACINERQNSIASGGKNKTAIHCTDDSLAGSVSQRACVFCGARVVLNPVTDAVHLVHGPIGCATYTWDIRGSLSSGSEMYRNSFSTDMKEHDVVFGGEKKLVACIDEIVEKYHPPAIFVYATCVSGMIGDDIIAVSKAASARYGIDIIPVESSGFISGNKVVGYRAAAEALMKLITPKDGTSVEKTRKLNILGEYNLGGETWLIRNYLAEMGIEINVAFTGDSSVAALKQAPGAALNIVQCTGSMHWVAANLEKEFGTPFISVNFFGAENTADSLRRIAAFYDDPAITRRTETLIAREMERIRPVIRLYGKSSPANVQQSMWAEPTKQSPLSGSSGNSGWRSSSPAPRPAKKRSTTTSAECLTRMQSSSTMRTRPNSRSFSLKNTWT